MMLCGIGSPCYSSLDIIFWDFGKGIKHQKTSGDVFEDAGQLTASQFLLNQTTIADVAASQMVFERESIFHY